MRSVALFVAVVLLSVTGPALACNDPAHLRLVKRQTEALEVQAKTLEKQERLLREQNKLLDRQVRAQR